MDYQVPQFIEVEDKIFGPLTLRQFIYLAGGGGLVAILVLSLPLVFAIVLSLPVGGLALALAFYKINGKPFIEMLEAGFTFFIGKRLFLWKKVKEPLSPAAVVETPAAPVAAPKQSLSRRKLEELAWSLDVKDTGAKPE